MWDILKSHGKSYSEMLMVLKQNKLIENSSAWEGTLGHFLGNGNILELNQGLGLPGVWVCQNSPSGGLPWWSSG